MSARWTRRRPVIDLGLISARLLNRTHLPDFIQRIVGALGLISARRDEVEAVNLIVPGYKRSGERYKLSRFNLIWPD